MSKYRCMDLLTAEVSTPAVVRLVEHLETGDLTDPKTQIIFEAAIHSQIEVCRKTRGYLPLDSTFSLFFFSRKGIRRFYAILIWYLMLKILRILGWHKSVGREVLVSHPTIYPEIPVIGRPGVRLPYVKYFGLHYQIFEEKIVVTLMPSVSWTVPNAEVIAVLQESLEQIQALIRRIKSDKA